MNASIKFIVPKPIKGDAIDAFVRLSILALILYWAALLVQPFLILITWSIVLVIVLYPAYSWSTTRLHLPSAIATGAIVAFCLITLLGPATWLALSLGASLRWVTQGLATGEIVIPPPSETVRNWPLIGAKTYDLWSLASTNFTEALVKFGPELKPLSTRLISLAGTTGLGMFKFIIAVFVAGFLFKPGPSLVKTVGSVFRRLTAEHGDEYVQLVGISVKNLARGVIGVALLQSLLVGIGLIFAGVPGAGLISLSVLILAVIQVGSAVVIIPVVIWRFFTMDTFSSILFAIYMVPVGLVDNFLRPVVMARGLITPMPIILIGLIGGLWVHGLIGMFVGPIVLAVAWQLIEIWIKRGTDETASN